MALRRLACGLALLCLALAGCGEKDEGGPGGGKTARAFAAVLLLFLLAIALYGACALLERRVVDWLPRTEPGGP